MKRERKLSIDALWMHTDYGQWVLNSADGNEQEAEEIAKKIAKKYPFSLDAADNEISKLIASSLESSDEFEEYLKMLDDEDFELVEFMIANDVFGTVYKELLK